MKLELTIETSIEGCHISSVLDFDRSRPSEHVGLGYTGMVVSHILSILDEMVKGGTTMQKMESLAGSLIAKAEAEAVETWPFDKTYTKE